MRPVLCRFCGTRAGESFKPGVKTLGYFMIRAVDSDCVPGSGSAKTSGGDERNDR
jgi:hypothetical protein